MTLLWRRNQLPMESFFEIFVEVCLPILVTVGLGWMLDRIFELNLRTLIRLIIYLFVSVFILVRLSTSVLDGAMGGTVIFFTLCVISSMGLLSWLLSKIHGYSAAERSSMQLSTMIYNSGNWGIPLMTLAFSNLGAVVQVFVLATMNLSTFSLGIFLASNGGTGKGIRGWRRLLPIVKQPSVYAILTALIIRVAGNPLDDVVFIWKPLNYIADGLVGFALLTLGVQLSKTRPRKPVGRLGWTLFIRLIAGPAVAIGLTWLMGLHGEIAAILILGAAAPTAVNTALIAHEFEADSEFAATVVFYSTLSAAFVVAVLLTILRAGYIPWAQG